MGSWFYSFIKDKKSFYGILIGLLFGSLISTIYIFNGFSRLQFVMSDHLRQNFTIPPESSDVVYLLITDATLIEADEVDGIQWPWPREAYGEALKFLQNAGVKLIVFDMIFSETSSAGPEDDGAFAKSIQQGNVILATLSSDKKGNTSTQRIEANMKMMEKFSLNMNLETDAIGLKDYPYHRPPIKVLLDASTKLGDVKFLPDEDGIGRRTSLLVKSGDQYFPSLSLASSMQLLGIDKVRLTENRIVLEGVNNQREIPIDKNGLAMLKYYGDSSFNQKYLLLRVIKSQLKIEEGEKPYYEPSLFKNKIVIIGSDATELKDLRPNPFNTKNDPGVHYHGTAIDNIIKNNFLKNYYSPVFVLPVILLLSLLIGLSAPNLSAVKGLAITSVLVLTNILLAVALFRYHNALIDISATSINIIGSFSLITIVNYLVETEQKTFITGAFGQYLSPKVVSELVKNPQKLTLGGEERVMTAFFSDVAGFSTISEKLTPQELVALLNDYLSEMCEIIGKYEGTVDKFEGDAIIAFWGAPIATEDHALLACKATVEMQEKLIELRERWKNEGRDPLHVRIGLNTGPMVVGNMGSRSRMDYTMMGDAVNLAARLEGANKFYGTYTMVSEATWNAVKNDFDGRELDLLRVVGKNEPVRVYELLALKNNISSDLEECLINYDNGLQLYRSRKFKEALELFEKAERAGDPPSAVYAKRCIEMIENNHGESWDGVCNLTSKG